jgi:tripartite-type tricarboxylate transporter receptor subunit TctC
MRRTLIATGLALAGALIASGAAAQSPADFYGGRNIDLIVGSGPGGGYDLYARLIARHIGEYIPGKPTVIVKNMAGGGGIRAGNFLYNVAPRDGSTLGTFSNAMITAPLIGSKATKFDPSKLTWIGSSASEDGICIASHSSGVKTWDDVLKKKLLVGTAAPGTTTYTYPVMLSNMFGAKFELVTGYPDASQVGLAIERGEVQGICQTYSSLHAQHPEWIAGKQANVLVTLGLHRIPDLPAVPSVMELVKNDEQTRMLKLILAPIFAGRPLFAPPEIPADRGDALRRAFDAVVKNPKLIADAEKQRLGLSPQSGEAVEELVKGVYASPPALVEKVKQVVSKPQG